MTVETGARVPAFELPNVGTGPDPFSLSSLPEDVSFAVLFFQRDHYCTNCRQQVQDVDARIEEFHDRDAEVVSIVPEAKERVAGWQEEYDLSFPLLADAEAEVGTAYDQPVRFGVLGRFSDFLGRMPEVVIVDRRGDEPEIAYVYRGSSTFDRPDLNDLLAELDQLCAIDSPNADC
jgi:peroxiredoxin Q/BCP